MLVSNSILEKEGCYLVVPFYCCSYYFISSTALGNTQVTPLFIYSNVSTVHCIATARLNENSHHFTYFSREHQGNTPGCYLVVPFGDMINGLQCILTYNRRNFCTFLHINFDKVKTSRFNRDGTITCSRPHF